MSRLPTSWVIWFALVVLFLFLLMARPAQAATWVAGRDGNDLQALLDRTNDGDRVEVPKGVWRGSFRVTRRITLVGKGGVLDGEGRGTVLRVEAAGAIVQGLRVQGSGHDLGAPDTCIYTTPEAIDVVVKDNTLRDCAFGIWIHRSLRARVEGNDIEGRKKERPADRGNGVHLFDARHLTVTHNTVRNARDGVYVSATHDSLIAYNRVSDLRYGVHYMYSYRNTLRGNESRHNLAGLALMQSRELIVEDNIAEDNERHGILFRDAQLCSIRRNRVNRNGQGLFFFSSTQNQIEENEIGENEIGAKIWAGSVRNEVHRNIFRANRQQIFYVGSQDLIWGEGGNGNAWSDYFGWDQDGDGFGDRPHRVNSFSANLVYRYPAAAFLMRSPALELLAHLEEILPILRVPTVVDRSPLLEER